jgi:hypothetical protein
MQVQLFSVIVAVFCLLSVFTAVFLIFCLKNQLIKFDTLPETFNVNSALDVAGILLLILFSTIIILGSAIFAWIVSHDTAFSISVGGSAVFGLILMIFGKKAFTKKKLVATS